MSEPRHEGACRCGSVRFAATGRPLVTMACHCRGCQRMTASAFCLSSLYPAEAFEVVQGETVLGGMKGATRHHFCPSCMSWLFTRPEGLDSFVNVRSALFADAAAHRPYVDMYRREALPGVDSGAVERFDTAPKEDEFGALMNAYAAWADDGKASE